MILNQPTEGCAHGLQFWQLRRVLRVDPVLSLGQFGQRRDLWAGRPPLDPDLEAMQARLEAQGFACTQRRVGLSVGARRWRDVRFVCASEHISRFTDWNLRQLAGLAACRAGLGIPAHLWRLRALERCNTPLAIPDAVLGQGQCTVALEWDSGSATRSELRDKVRAYHQVAGAQLWVAPTIQRARTLESTGGGGLDLGQFGVLAVDWTSGALLEAMLPDRGSWLEWCLFRVMAVDAPWGLWHR